VRFDTLLVQSGQRATTNAGDVVPPVHLAATYERGQQEPRRYFYARGENPTREGLEGCLADLEGARFATVFSSGQAAASTVLSLLSRPQRIVATDDNYSGTSALFGLVARAGVRVDQVDLSVPDEAARVLSSEGPRADLVWVETPSNPLLKVTDLEVVCRRAHDQGAIVVVDNTFASPALQQPLQWADISLYSTTKSISGHLDVLGGALVYNDERLHDHFVGHRTVVGNVPGALDCYLVRRGLKTLSVRTTRQVESAAMVVAALQDAPLVGAVRYPGLPEHPGHQVAARQMSAFGSMISFDYLGDTAKVLNEVKVFAPAVSLGGVQSLIECPASMTHASVPREERERAGISDNLIRLSIGIEDPRDLIADIRAALRPC
jgi:cystathionine gamma-lyase